MQSTVDDAVLGWALLNSLLSAAMVAAVAADSGRRKRRGDWLLGGLAHGG
jgi:hypothetical protein